MKKYLIQLWSLFDTTYLFCTRLQCLEKITGNTNVFRVRLTRYKGREVVLSDGTAVKKNDLLVKIHLHNVRLLAEMQRMDSNLAKARFLYKKVQQSIPDLAVFIFRHKYKKQIKGIIGITMIDTGYKRLGFEAFLISNRSYTQFKRIAHYPIYWLSHNAAKNKRPTPQYLFMSKEILCNKYGPSANHVA